MPYKNRQSFLHGAIILVTASFLVKALGAVFKIPLTVLIKEEGMGLFNTSYTLYTFFVLAAKGFSIAVSKMVSESIALEKRREADKIFYISFITLGILGTAGSALLYFNAQGFSEFFKNTRAAVCIRAIAPSVLFVTLVSTLRGYFQGKQNMYPTAVSEVIEALGKLIIGMLFAFWFVNSSIEKAAAGAVLGVTASTFFGLLFIAIVFAAGKKDTPRLGNENVRSVRDIVFQLLTISLPITIGASVASLANIVDVMTIMKRLQSITQVNPEFIVKYQSIIGEGFDGSITEAVANKLYGLYSGYAVLLFNLPLTIIVAISTSVLPAISSAITRQDKKGAQIITKSAIRITVLFSLPCAVGLGVLAGPILKLILNNSLAEDLLRTISAAIVFVSVVQVTNAILQAYGKMHIPVINMIIGVMVKIAINYTLIAIPSINIDGAPIGTLACYFLIAMLNMIYIARHTKTKFEAGEYIFKPLFSALCMAIVVRFFLNIMWQAGIGDKVAVIPAILVGAVIYTVLIFLTGAVARSDIEMLPKSERLLRMLQKIYLLK